MPVSNLTGRPPWRLIAAIVVVGALTGAMLIGVPTRVEWYRLADEDTLVIGTTTGGSGTSTWVRHVGESDEIVKIEVRTVNLPLAMGAIDSPLELTIDLEQPLGERTALDADLGEPVPSSQ